MGHETALVLWALLALEIKHFLCDFVFQTEYQVRTKGIYGHVGGFIHSGYHTIGTIPALLIMQAPLRAIVIIMIGEFLIHYHTDWTKSNVDSLFRLGPVRRALLDGVRHRSVDLPTDLPRDRHASHAGHAQLGLTGSDHSTLRKNDFMRAIKSFSTVET